MSPDIFTSESRAVPNLRRWAPFFPLILPHDTFSSVIFLQKLIHVPWNSLTFTDPSLIQNFGILLSDLTSESIIPNDLPLPQPSFTDIRCVLLVGTTSVEFLVI